MSHRLEDHWVEIGEAAVTALPRYTASLAPHEHTGGLVAHYDEVRYFEKFKPSQLYPNGASRRVTVQFQKQFAFGGVYGLVDPLADWVVYVGRSANIGDRFRQHLKTDDSVKSCIDKRYYKRHWIWDTLERGQKPGLVILSRVNSDQEEKLWIERLRPEFNSMHTGYRIYHTHRAAIEATEAWRREQKGLKAKVAIKPNVKTTPRQSRAINLAKAKGVSRKYIDHLKSR